MISISDNVPQFLASLEKHHKAVGFAQTVALTRTARATSLHLGGVIKRVFDRPVPFTQNAVTWLWATADKLMLDVFVRFNAGKGTPASKYLRAQVYGGERAQKRSEVALAQSILTRDVMGNRGYWVPGPGVKLDAYGNVPGSTMRRILSELKVAGDQSMTARSRKRNKRYRAERYFIPTKASGLAPGVWVERAGRIEPALFFVHSPRYSQRFDFFGEGMRFAEQRYPVEIAQALREGWHLPRAVQKAVYGGRI
jgi:hypothetical protein